MALSTNLVSYYKFDESSGDAADSVGSNTLTNNNTVTYGAAVINNGALFASASSQSLSILDASQSGLDITGNLSYAGWANFSTTPTSNNGMAISSKWGAVAAAKSYYFLLFNNAGTMQLAFFNGDAVSTQTIVSVNWSPSTSTWYHVAVVYTAAGGTGDFYVNGVQQGTQQSGLLTSIGNGSGAFQFGRTDNVAAEDYMNGKTDEFGIWSRTLSGSETSQLYNGGAGLTYPFNLSKNLSLLGVGT